VVALAGSGAALLAFSPAPATRPLADGCGLVTCDARLPPSATGLAVRGTPQGVRRHHPARPPVAPEPAPSVTSDTPRPAPASRPPRRHGPPPAPVPSPPWHSHRPHVTVTYTLDGGGDQWQHSFRAHLTIINKGHLAVAGWTIELSLPGDQVSWVGYPDAPQPFAIWQLSGSFLVLQAVSSGETISPGGTEVVPIFADGPSTAPSGCTFNGVTCRS
jgi:hypothetical protein